VGNVLLTIRDVLPQSMPKLTDEQRRALRLLASIPNGCTETLMLARGFELSMLRTLPRDGLAGAEPYNTFARGQHITMTLMRITEAGRKAIAQ
jgi:hypothetical protein